MFRRGVVGLGGSAEGGLELAELQFGSADEGWASEGDVSMGLSASAIVEALWKSVT